MFLSASKKLFPLLLACAVLASCAQQEPRPRSVDYVDQGSDILHDCTVRVEFGSYGSGIDGKTYARVMDYVGKNESVLETHVEALGREGERTLCLMTEDGRDQAVYDGIRGIIPTISTHGWEKITSVSGGTFETSEPQEFTPRRL